MLDNLTNWPNDLNKIPDPLDFYVINDISSNYIEAEELIELTSDHIPLFSSNAIIKERKIFLANKKID